MQSELNDYQDAVDAQKAMPFGVLHEDWIGVKMSMHPAGVRQIALSPEVLAEPPGDFVGDLSHGLGYFHNYERDRLFYDNSMGSHPDEATARVIAGRAGVMMESRAEVNNYLVQQEIANATRATTPSVALIKLANDDRSHGALQLLFDRLTAENQKQGLAPEQNQAELEKSAFAITGSIPIPRRSPPSTAGASLPDGTESTVPSMPATESGRRERAAFVDDFIRRLARVADSGTLDDPGKTMNLLNMAYRQDTVQMAASPPDCSVDWHPESQLRTDVQSVDDSWYHPSPFGIRSLFVPAFMVNPAVAINGAPKFAYSVTRTIRCTDSFRLQDKTEAKLDLYPLPPFACITRADIARALPRASYEVATDGVSVDRYQGKLDDDSGSTLTFGFRAGALCALSASIGQSQEDGLRFRRAVSKLQACSAEVTQPFCAAHPPFSWGDPLDGELRRLVTQRCGTLNTVYLKEPRSGQAPPPSAIGIRHGPCG